VFVDYPSNHKGYTSLSPNGKTCISKAVLINEFGYPYSISKSTNSTSHAASFPTFSTFGVFPSSSSSIYQLLTYKFFPFIITLSFINPLH
jgi:hypothetical protein